MSKWGVFVVLTLALAASPIHAASPDASMTIKINGKLGPTLAGTDPENANGKAGVIVLTVNKSLSPQSHTATVATYKIPAGSVKATIAGKVYKNAGSATMKIGIPLAGMDTLTVTGTYSVAGTPTTISGTISLKRGSFTASALKHPQPFYPPSQAFSPALSAQAPGSKLSYSAAKTGKTVLGLSGTADAK